MVERFVPKNTKDLVPLPAPDHLHRRFPRHPLSALMPPHSEDEIAALAESIKARGQHERIVLLDGEVLDGWARLIACQRIGEEPTTRDLPKDIDPIDFLIDKNVRRRHLTAGQRAFIASELATFSHGGDRKTEGGRVANLRLDQAAKLLGVSTRSISSARELVDAERDDLIAKVKAGAIALDAAVTISQLTRYTRRMSAAEITEHAGAFALRERRAATRSPRDEQSPEDKVVARLLSLAFRDSHDLRMFHNAIGRLRKAEPDATRTDTLKKLEVHLHGKREQLEEASRSVEVSLYGRPTDISPDE